MKPIEIDGTMGEGGGQILRTALSLSIITANPFRISRIRGKRKKPGLRRQHLAAVEAAREICGGRADGAAVGSMELEFRPDRPRAGSYRFDIGSAGSTLLVLQTILPPLFLAEGESEVRIAGGTHNPMAPPFDFAARSFLPLIGRMGFQASLDLLRHGFAPSGGGEIRARVSPHDPGAAPLRLEERPPPRGTTAAVVISSLPRHIAAREAKVLRQGTGLEALEVEIREAPADGPGNAVLLAVDRGGWADVFAAIGERGKPAEAVAGEAVRAWREHRDSAGAVESHLADQLLIYLALSASGSFTAGPPSLHATTNLEVIDRFLPGLLVLERRADGSARFSTAAEPAAAADDRLEELVAEARRRLGVGVEVIAGRDQGCYFLEIAGAGRRARGRLRESFWNAYLAGSRADHCNCVDHFFAHLERRLRASPQGRPGGVVERAPPAG